MVADGGPPISRRRDDTWVQRAARFRVAFNKCVKPLQYWAVSEQFPDLFFAHQLWDTRNDEEKQLLTHEVEARILCNETSQKISDRCGIETEAVDAYEALFFNVRARLSQKSYIMHQVLGRAAQFGIRERAFDLIWKLYAYKGGPRVLDMMVDTMADVPWPDNSDEVDAWLADVGKSGLTKKYSVAVHTMDASNGFTQLEIIGAYHKFREIESTRDGGVGGPQSTYLANIQGMLNALPFAVGGKASTRTMTAVRVAQFSTTSVEPRGDEMMMLAAGETPAHLKQIESLTFPELPAAVGRVLESAP